MASFTPDTTNDQFNTALELVNQSSRNIFLTGKAGTGKTTFLKYIKEHCPKQIAVVAPTGVAAINAGGVTIHSFFQLPFAPFIPGQGNGRKSSAGNEETVDRHALVSRLRFNDDKRKVLQELELLVIDEISMVRCDTLDAIDTVLRYVRRRPLERFGGVQVLFIGDMFQLAPVIREQEWMLLCPYYNSPYFFESRVMQEEQPVYIEFEKIYRQNEERFIRLLNQVRNNELDEDGMNMLEARFQPSFRRSKEDGYIILTTHNDTAREINARELESLEGSVSTYIAQIDKEFPERAFPADETLCLKVGAQVMFIRNDMDKAKRYFNGKIGMVTRLAEDKITVRCKDDQSEIEVKIEKWDNIRYIVNPASRSMEEEILGTFKQFPLRLAWAITIHKSQGLTFEKAIIDAGEAFAPGQVYVALSRCTNLDGMILRSRIRPHSLLIDDRIVEYSRLSALNHPAQTEMAELKRKYLLSVLSSLFDYKLTASHAFQLQSYIKEHQSSFNPEAFSWIEKLATGLKQIQETGARFQLELETIFATPDLGDNNLSSRTNAAARYFISQIDLLLADITKPHAETDSRGHANNYNETLKEIFSDLAMRKYILEGFGEGFDADSYHKRKKAFRLQAFTINAYSGVAQQRKESAHPELYQRLRKKRDNICLRSDLPVYLVAGSRTLDEMSTYLPHDADELEKISGFGKAKVERYGQEFLEIIREYCEANGLSSGIASLKPKRERKIPKPLKTDTKAESFRLYRQGLRPEAIATARSLTVQTIEGHLAHYISSGDIDIHELISPAKLALIEAAIQSFDGGSLTPVKENLGNEASFGEIRLAIAWQERKKLHQ